MPDQEIEPLEKPEFSLLMFWEDITAFFEKFSYFFKSIFGLNH